MKCIKKNSWLTYSTLLILCLTWWFALSTCKAANYDRTPPTLSGVKVLNNSVYAPGTIQVEVSGLREDETGVVGIVVGMKLYDPKSNIWTDYTYTGSAYLVSSPLYTGDKCIISVNIPEEAKTGTYYPSFIYIRDARQNSSIYRLEKKFDFSDYNLISVRDESKTRVPVNTYIKVYGEEFDLDVAVSNPNIDAQIRKMPDGGTVNVFLDGTGRTAIPKKAFDAIKGTNKKISVKVSTGVKWLFSGKDITGTTKDIDCKVNISAVQDESLGTTDKLMKIEFASNGTLPGKAIIKLKSDYIKNLYDITKPVHLYYVQNTSLKLETSSVEVILDGSDTWCEFPITHNSTFVLSNKKLSYVKPYVKLNASKVALQLGKSSSAIKIDQKRKTDSVKSWTSSKPKVVTVNKKTGTMKAKKVGTSYITVTMNSGAKAKCRVTVQKGAVKTKSIILKASKVTLKKKAKYTLGIKRTPITANDPVKYKTSNKKIITVNSKGKVTAVKKGKAYVTIKAGNKQKKVHFTVK